MAINPSTDAMAGQMLGLLSDTSFTQLVNEALRNYQSTLALSRSPLANSPLVTPTLVKDEASPTAEERGHGLRLVLQWAVNQLAPGAPTYPLGKYRPLDDPTWLDPHWWRYNILRHRYLEPLHPDDFVGGGRYTESLLALTGISSTDAFFDERNRAIRAVAEQLRQQLIDGQAQHELQRLALQEVMSPLEKETDAAKVLGIATTFEDIFPRSLLLELATQEWLEQPAVALDTLIAQRFLLTGDAEASLWLSPVLRAYVYERQQQADCQRRHRLVAGYYEAQDDVLRAARHWQLAQQDARAARVLLPAVDELIHELQVRELTEFLQQLEPKRLVDDQWYHVQVLLGDLFQRNGQHEDALAACRQALQAGLEPQHQARVYRRMGKLYESRNQLHALRYYQQAVERFPPRDPELAELLKDRGWLYYLRQEWSKAEADLQQALTIVTPAMQVLQADIYDAMANLYRKMNTLDQALLYGERALAIREEVGDLLRIAKSLGNLGFLYRAMGEYGPAIAAHEEALATYQKIGNQELSAMAFLNIGATHYLNGKVKLAIDAYQKSLAIGQTIELPLVEIKAHYNLAEALGAGEQLAAAQHHWQLGYGLCRRYNFDDQEALFHALQDALQLPAREESLPPFTSPLATLGAPDATPVLLDGDEQLIVSIVEQEGAITPKRLMDAANISRATATRRLTALVEKGVLVVEGKGRGTQYRLAGQATPAPTVVTGDDLSVISQALQQLGPELSERHAITALGVIPMTLSSQLKIVVRFDQIPDLQRYFQLRRQLAEALQMDIDLLPVEQVAPPLSMENIHWL
ncbi:MAG: tetratricopeptide repeat protein [Caldilineaceae bacterium]